MDLQTKKKNEGAALDPPCSGKATRKQALLTPTVSLRQTFFDDENIVFGKICYFMIFPREGK